jgi:transposase-like protein
MMGSVAYGRRSFSREFKLEAVKLVGERGVSVARRQVISACPISLASRRRLI